MTSLRTCHLVRYFLFQELPFRQVCPCCLHRRWTVPSLHFIQRAVHSILSYLRWSMNLDDFDDCGYAAILS